MHVFYTPDIAQTLELPEEEAGHCLRVLRLGVGEEIMLTDGKGCFYRAVISAATQKRCVVKVVEKTEQEPFWKGHLHLALAPTKNMDRMEWLAEKATEIGFDELTFLNCRFSERKVIKTERVEKIVVSAVKQSLKARKPVNIVSSLNSTCTNRYFDSFGCIRCRRNTDIRHGHDGRTSVLCTCHSICLTVSLAVNIFVHTLGRNRDKLIVCIITAAFNGCCIIQLIGSLNQCRITCW